MCLALCWTHKECSNSPTSQPPSTACTRPGSPKLTKSPGSDRTKCPGVSCSPHASPPTPRRDQLAPREQETSSSGHVPRVLIPRTPPPRQAHAGLARR